MSKRKLLVADDSITIQKVVNLTFADEGFDVITVDNGDDALRQISGHRPDIVLADVSLPGPNGYEICEMVRRIDEVKDLPIVLLVGSFEPFDEERALRSGANDFITKPFSSIRQLVATVNGFIAAPSPVQMPTEPLPEPQDRSAEISGTPPIQAPDSSFGSLRTDAHESEEVSLSSEIIAEPGYTGDIDELYGQSVANDVRPPAGDNATSHEYTDDRDQPSVTAAVAAELSDELGMDGRVLDPGLAATALSKGDPNIPLGVDENVDERSNFLRDLENKEPQSYLSHRGEDESFYEADSEIDPDSAAEEAMALRTERPVPANSNGNGTSASNFREDDAWDDESIVETRFGTGRNSDPWESVATPLGPVATFDEPNLLDLPPNSSDMPVTAGRFQQAARPDPLAISDDLIDQIAERVANRLSEDQIREIAERIVPRVVESFMLRKFRRDDDES